MSSSNPKLPNVAELLGEVLQRVPEAESPLLIALAERMGAVRYRGWAGEVARPERRSELLACADREEEIARRVAALHPDAASIQRRIQDENPDLESINRSVFAARPLAEQFEIQAQGERLGAATWRALAERADNPKTRETLLACADLEEASADVLERYLAEGV